MLISTDAEGLTSFHPTRRLTKDLTQALAQDPQVLTSPLRLAIGEKDYRAQRHFIRCTTGKTAGRAVY